MRYFTFLVAIVLHIMGSCKKPCEPEQTPMNPTPKGCPEMYEIRSEPYNDLFMGSLFTGCAFSPALQYPDQYVYRYLTVNPNNSYEIAYLRRHNGVQPDSNVDLYKYNFCSGESTFLCSNAALIGGLDWSVKGWILFTGSQGLSKIKDNGDSLTSLNFQGTPIGFKWNTTGNLLITNYTTIMNENGQVVSTIPHSGGLIGWYDSDHILSSYSSAGSLFKTNVYSANINLLFTINNVGYSEYDAINKSLFYGRDSLGMGKYYHYNIETEQSTFLGGWYLQSYIPVFSNGLNNKILIQLQLTDTITGDPCIRNYRSQIAIMDMDGSNLRRVMIPE